MSMVDLSLDEIIARRKGANKKSNGFINRFRNNKKKRDFAPKYTNTNPTFTRAEDVPSGKWDHSGFEEMYGSGSGGSSLRVAPERDGRFNRVDLTKKVRLHITNLAPTVNSADLNELFEQYSIISANVNHDETGKSVGTADVVTDRVTAREIIANLDGVALDGQVMSFHMIDDQATPARPNVRIKNRLNFRRRSWGVTKKRQLPPKRKFTGTIGNRKNYPKNLKISNEQLDRELDEYMNKRHKQKQDEQKMEI